MQALWLSLDAPERVKSVVAIGTPAVVFGAPRSSLRVLARPVMGSMMLGMPKPPGLYRRILAETWSGRSLPPAGAVANRVCCLPRGHLAWVPGGHEPGPDDIDACGAVLVRALGGASAASLGTRI